MSEPMISANNLGKRYVLGAFGATSFRDELGVLFSKLRRSEGDVHSGYRRNKEFWALKNVSFEIEEGDTVGLIGRNGAGKSTLLKLLSRITMPTTGGFTMNGKSASLLEVGTGFHPDLSGIENVYLNGAILGMRRWEIKSKLDSILDFSGVAKFADTPVKRYSSGMRVRLAFAVAAHLRQDILIVDEVLAVGDHEFQKKCLGKMGEVSREGRTVVFVSHNMFAISRLCRKCMYLKDAQLVTEGLTEDVIPQYLSDTKGKGGSVEWNSGFSDPGVHDFRLLAVRFMDSKNTINNKFSVLDPIRIEVDFETDTSIRDFIIKMNIRTGDGITILGISNYSASQQPGELGIGRYTYSAVIPAKRINCGSYNLSMACALRQTRFLVRLDDFLDFDVDLLVRGDASTEILNESGIIYPESTWEYKKH